MKTQRQINEELNRWLSRREAPDDDDEDIYPKDYDKEYEDDNLGYCEEEDDFEEVEGDGVPEEED